MATVQTIINGQRTAPIILTINSIQSTNSSTVSTIIVHCLLEKLIIIKLTTIYQVRYMPELTVDLVCAVDEGMFTPGKHLSN